MLWPYMLDPSERLIGVLFALLVALFSPATRSSPLEIAMTCWNLKLSFVKNVPHQLRVCTTVCWEVFRHEHSQYDHKLLSATNPASVFTAFLPVTVLCTVCSACNLLLLLFLLLLLIMRARA